MARKPDGSNIFDLKRRRGDHARLPAVETIETYWQSLCDGATLPRRAAIDPRDLAPVLEFAFVLERIAPGVGRFRLAGNHLSDLMGLEVRGMPATAIFLPEARGEIARVFEKTCAEPGVALLELAAAGGLGRAALRAQMLLCPLLDDAGQVSRVLGCLQTTGSIGRQPRRFSITGVELRTLTLAAPSPASHGPAPLTAGFGETAARFDHGPFDHGPGAQKPEKSRPALHLVVNNG
jgi:hypothetical protein